MCRRKDSLLPFFFFIFLSCKKEKAYSSDCFLYSSVPFLHGTCQFVSAGLQSQRTWGCYVLMTFPWIYLIGQVLGFTYIAAGNLYVKESFLPAPLHWKILSISDLSAVNTDSPRSSYLLKQGVVGRDWRGGFSCVPEQSLKFTVNKLFDHDFIAPVSPKTP